MNINHYELHRHTAVEFVLKEVKAIVRNICPQTHTSVFKQQKSGYTPYNPCDKKSTSSSQADNSTGNQGLGSSLTQLQTSQGQNVTGTKDKSHSMGKVSNTQGYVPSSVTGRSDTKTSEENKGDEDGVSDQKWKPGSFTQFILIGRSMNQWKNSLQRESIDLTDSAMPQITEGNCQ